MAEYKQIHKVEVEKKPFKLTKKMIALLVIAIVLVVGVITAYIVTADKDGYTSSVQNSSSEVISGDVSVTKKGLYEYLLDNYGANEVLNEAYNKITAKEITDKDAINTKVKELKQRYAEYSGSFETYAKNQGYSDAKTFEKEVVVPEAKSDLLEEKYLDTKFNDVCKKYNVSYLKIVEYSKESEALKALKTVTSADAMTALINANTSSSTDLGFVCSKSSTTTVDKKIIKALSKFTSLKTDSVYKEAVKLSTGKYAVVYVYNTDKSALKNDIVKNLLNLGDVKTDIETYYLKKYKFTVDDEKVKKQIKKISSKYVD